MQSTTQYTPLPELDRCFVDCWTGIVPATRTGRTQYGKIEVNLGSCPYPKLYPASKVLSLEEGTRRLEEMRANQVVYQYTWQTISESPLVIKVTHPTEWRRSYVLTMGAGGMGCSCPAFCKSLAGGEEDGKPARAYGSCKHASAYYLKYTEPAKAEGRPSVKPIAAGDW